ncbi:hypothetical protein O9993_15850 [Vibrio lentus]|nr:hypothetical protein [Vibrio lentus]
MMHRYLADLLKSQWCSKGEEIFFDVGIQYHRACYQHPVVKRIEGLLSTCLKAFVEGWKVNRYCIFLVAER